MPIRLLLLLLSCLLAGPGQSQPAPDLPARVVAPTDSAQFRRFVLDNGLRVLLVSDPRFSKSAASLAIDVGQIDDPRDTQGLAHFLEHMLFLGTDKYPEVGEYSRFIARNGGSQNAYTASDHTNYQFELRHDALPAALDRFAQFFIAPRFNPEFVSREVSAVHNEAMRHVQNDFRRVWAVQREIYDPASGESLFSTGNKDTLARATPQAVRAFYERHYSADRMALAIAGRVSLDELERLARTHFAAIPRRASAVATVHAPTFLPRKPALRLLQVEPVNELRQLQLEFVLPPTRPMFASRSDRLLIDLLEYAGPGGLLHRLKAEGLAHGVSAWLWERTPAYGSLWLTLDLTPAGQREQARALALVFGWVDFLRQGPFPQAFFDDRARIGRLQETHGDRGEGSALAVRLANQALFYPLAVAERAGTAWGAPDETAWRRLLAALVPDNLLAALVAKGLPTDRRERIYGVAYAYREDTGPAYTALLKPPRDAGFALPGANAFMPGATPLLAERALPLIDEPGLALHWAADTEFQRPQTAVVMRVVPVRSMASAESAALLGLWERCLRDALDADVADARAAGVGLGFDFGLEGVKISLTGYGDSPARVAHHLVGRLRSFDVGPTRFADLKERTLRGLASYAQTEAWTLARDRRNALQREVMHLPDQLQAPTQAAGWPQVQAFGLQLLAQGRLELLVHGHMPPADAVDLARALAGALSLRPAAPGELMHRRHLQLAAGEQVVDAGLVEGVNAAWIGDYLLGDDSPRQRAASLVLGSFVSSPFMTELRTRQQLGYIVGASASVSLRERWLTFVIQSSTHASADLRQRAEAFIAGLPAALAALSDSEWATLKAGVRSRLEEKPTSIGQRAERLFAEAYLFDGDWGRGPAAVDALATLGQADAVALLSEALAPATARRRTVQLDPSSRPPAAPVAASFSDRESWKRTRRYR